MCDTPTSVSWRVLEWKHESGRRQLAGAVRVLRSHGIDVNVEAYGCSGVLRRENAGVAAFDCGSDHLECEGENGSVSLSVTVGWGPRAAAYSSACHRCSHRQTNDSTASRMSLNRTSCELPRSRSETIQSAPNRRIAIPSYVKPLSPGDGNAPRRSSSRCNDAKTDARRSGNNLRQAAIVRGLFRNPSTSRISLTESCRMAPGFYYRPRIALKIKGRLPLNGRWLSGAGYASLPFVASWLRCFVALRTGKMPMLPARRTTPPRVR